ncbi:hypothetical protein NDU88_006247 [Pleurodeles waltl]|uniref:Uncharacterized protein n=1 Tax=Pleurodeles waltl TaxID=8319 RepID=A0AAV7WF04_PLEWA|nr:hypothetical protein NDU88_006247 [Pleurodeles waltl]
MKGGVGHPEVKILRIYCGSEKRLLRRPTWLGTFTFGHLHRKPMHSVILGGFTGALTGTHSDSGGGPDG